jgi:hypothetical protein
MFTRKKPGGFPRSVAQVPETHAPEGTRTVKRRFLGPFLAVLVGWVERAGRLGQVDSMARS